MSDAVIMGLMALAGGALSSVLLYFATRGNTVATVAEMTWDRAKETMAGMSLEIADLECEIADLKAAAVKSEERESGRDVVIEQLTAKVKLERSRRIEQVTARDERIKALEEQMAALTDLLERTVTEKDAKIAKMDNENGRLRAQVKQLKNSDLL